MFLKGRFYEWTTVQVIGTISLLFFALFILFAGTNIGAGPMQEISGTIRNLGMDTGTVFTLSRRVATIEAETGENVLVAIPASVTVKEGSEVIVGKMPRLWTDGYKYTFLRVAK